jgi:hypothetical protein
MPSDSRSGRAGPIQNSEDRGRPNHQDLMKVADYMTAGYPGRILNFMQLVPAGIIDGNRDSKDAVDTGGYRRPH